MPRNKTEKLPTLETLRIPPAGAPLPELPAKFHERIFWNYGWNEHYQHTELGAVAKLRYSAVFDKFNQDDHDDYEKRRCSTLLNFYARWWIDYVFTWKEVHGAA